MAVQPFAEGASHNCESDMDSWGMNLMEEAAWLKNSATEDLNGIWKVGADALIDEAQSAALLPLLLGGPKAYVAGVAANAATEDMFKQTAEGKTASDAFLSGAVTAGKEILAEKITEVDVPDAEVPVKTMIATVKEEGVEGLKSLAKEAGVAVSEEGLLYLMDYLVDRIKGDPNAMFNPEDFLKKMAGSKVEDFSNRQAEKFFEELERAWKIID